MVTHATQKNPHQKIMSSMNPPFKKKTKETHAPIMEEHNCVQVVAKQQKV